MKDCEEKKKKKTKRKKVYRENRRKNSWHRFPVTSACFLERSTTRRVISSSFPIPYTPLHKRWYEAHGTYPRQTQHVKKFPFIYNPSIYEKHNVEQQKW